MLQLVNVTKRFGGLTAVKSLSCEVARGRIVGLIGPNGAGKTTAFNVISGFLRADEGQVFFEGQLINRLRPEQLCRLGICRTFQIVCAACKEPVFKVSRNLGDRTLDYFSHYRKDETLNTQCELRVNRIPAANL